MRVSPQDPVTLAEFAALMAALAPHDPARQVVAGISGGADSMALALLLRQWGDPLAVVIDHGLRPEAAAEAAITIARLQALGIKTRLVSLTLQKGPDLGARARTARYEALLAVCHVSGRPDLLIAHHAQDNAETVQIRAVSGSGPIGLAGIAPIAWRADARVLRPLLEIHPARLRATLNQVGLSWVEDPTNQDPATARGALRMAASPPCPMPTPSALRAALERAVATELAARATLFPTGHAAIAAPLGPDAWSALLWTLSGQPYPPSRAAVARLARAGQGTLHGVHVAAGLATREPAAMAPTIPARRGARWDGRFVLGRDIPGATIGALGPDAARLRRRPGLPSVVLRTLPALRIGTDLLAVPHLAYPDAETCRSVAVEFRPTRPLAGLSFAIP